MQPWENIYYHTLDWGYKDIKPKIIAEELISDYGFEYKFFCFNGEPKLFYVARDRAPGVLPAKDYFDMNWNLLPFKKGTRNFEVSPERPDFFEEMVELAKTLSKPFPHVRVDIIHSKGQLYVLELTFYITSGAGKFIPTEWDYKIGELFELPKASPDTM